ncbi:renalase-like [Schistocerca nitens]|uniref:renalase-like n=1 Tax=Schistocerca nitens TaxID=7011 RepID=UPI00211964A4|nr:renalase-like [Schistocerca nitens]
MALKVLIVGSGITSAITCNYLRERCRSSCRVIVWDKARGVGGRMSTSRSPTMDSCTADLGAQYITTVPENIEASKVVYSTCFTKGLLQPLQSLIEGMHTFPKNTVHYVAPRGMNSLVKEFLTADEVQFNRLVTSITQNGNKLDVETKDGYKDTFDVVVLTMPVPQILQLSGCVESVLSDDKEKREALSAVKYSSRYAVAYFYDKTLEFDVPWSAKYVVDDELLRYVAIDNKKRNSSATSAIVFHTTVKFGEENIERDVADVQRDIEKHINTLFPTWPKPVSVKCQKWRYSQATAVYEGSPGCITLIQEPLLIAGGDGFTKSTFDGCITSAKAIVNVVEKYITKELAVEGNR